MPVLFFAAPVVESVTVGFTIGEAAQILIAAGTILKAGKQIVDAVDDIINR